MAIIRRFTDRLLEHPAVYQLWQAPFADQKFAPIEAQLRVRPPKRILDVGCGPGTNAARFAGADYVGIDINEKYLEIARRQARGTFVQADLESADLSHLGMFDTILVNSVLHHLNDATVVRMLEQMAGRLTPEGRVHVLELVMPVTVSMPWLMATLDRGRFARPVNDWYALLSSRLETVSFEPYTYGSGLWSMVYFQGTQRT